MKADKERDQTKNNSSKSANGQKKKSWKPKKSNSKAESTGEEYVVIISNVENDFSKIHQACLPSYLGLANMNSEASQDSKKKCKYQIKCRTETRSAEFSFSAPSAEDLHLLFSPRKEKNTKDSSKKTLHGISNAKPEQSTKNTSSSTEEVSGDEAPTELEEFKEDLGVSTSTEKQTFESRLAFLQKHPYHGQYLRFDVNLPGKEDGAVLFPGCLKRKREDPTSDESKQKDDSQPSAFFIPPLKQHRCLQGDLVTAVAAVSAPWQNRELKHQLKDLPGFVTCWYLYPRHFRAVFVNENSLFQAKKLLDEFPIDEKVRVHLQLSDHLQRKHEESIAAENGGLQTEIV